MPAMHNFIMIPVFHLPPSPHITAHHTTGRAVGKRRKYDCIVASSHHLFCQVSGSYGTCKRFRWKYGRYDAGPHVHSSSKLNHGLVVNGIVPFTRSLTWQPINAAEPVTPTLIMCRTAPSGFRPVREGGFPLPERSTVSCSPMYIPQEETCQCTP